MGIKYREDKDLAFLEYCQENDLKILARYLTHDDMDRYVPHSPRFASELLEHPDFKKYDGYADQHQRCWQLIAGELQHFGGDTFINLFRGTGVLYKEILEDVCEKLKLDNDEKNSIETIENKLTEKFMSESWDKLEASQRAELLKSVGLDPRLAGAAGLLALQAALNAGGIASFRISAILANSVARLAAPTFGVVAGGSVGRSMAMLAGPIGLAIGVILTVPILSGAAYRVTILSAIQIAYMRKECYAQDRF